LIAVSNFLRKAKTNFSAIKISLSWAIGHMITAAIVTAALFYFGESLLESALVYFKKIVGAMLIIIGIWSLKEIFSFHTHIHSHGNVVHSHPHMHIKQKNHGHRHMFGIGIIHGLASNGELLILLTASLGISTLGGMLLGVWAFSIGVVAGMILFALLFSYPLIKSRSKKIYNSISFLAGSSGIVYGALVLFSAI
jgi:ABC-type nickel/cobalt efflux system permease component RcnA